jgi:hypothetical protein
VIASLYIDDDVYPELARLLRGRGIDAVSTLDAATAGQADDAHLEYAASQGRALLSYNFHDYLPMARQWADNGWSHAGIILSYRQFSRAQFGELLTRTLRLLAVVSAEELKDTVRFLDEFREE